VSSCGRGNSPTHVPETTLSKNDTLEFSVGEGEDYFAANRKGRSCSYVSLKPFREA